MTISAPGLKYNIAFMPDSLEHCDTIQEPATPGGTKIKMSIEEYKEYRAQRLAKFRPETHTCAKCNELFGSVKDLELHLRSHPSTKCYSCTTCGKEFSKVENLQLHQKLHFGQKDYVCSVCNRSYFTK
jgi:uncharacterized Zn-finger protein